MFNIFTLAFGAIGFALVLAVLITRQKLPGGQSLVPPESDYDNDPQTSPAPPLEKLYLLAERLCLENDLTITQKMVQSETEAYWIAESTNDFFFGSYGVGFLLVHEKKPFVTMSDVLEFKDFIKSTGGGKGLLLTNGYFTRDVHQPLEGPKLTLYNKLRVLTELNRFAIS
jgi:hypothetical protein